MNDNDTKIEPLATVKHFSYVIYVCCILWLVGFYWAYQVFGIATSIFLSLFLLIPLIVSLRLRRNYHSRSNREFAYLLILLIVIMGVEGAFVGKLYHIGADEYHEKVLVGEKFNSLLHKEIAFQNVEAFYGRKSTYFVRGTVARSSDLEHLQTLASESNIEWVVQVDVVDEQKK